MRIAILSDLHCNFVAFDAVLNDLSQYQFDEILVGGDLVGRGPFGSLMLERVREQKWRSVRGNHEEYMCNFRSKKVPSSWLVAKEWSAARWMANEIAGEHYPWMENLPFVLRAFCAPEIILTHGTLRSNQKGFSTWSNEEKLKKLLEELHGEVLIGCHTHRPFHFEHAGKQIINPGSVGNPMNGDFSAQYIWLEKSPLEPWKVTFRKIPYSVETYLDAFQASEFYDAGWLTSRLLYRELETARPHLVPYLRWVEETGKAQDQNHLEEFYEIFDPVSLSIA